jgi:predicted DNA-binding protein YlxM (UPF0122 family)
MKKEEKQKLIDLRMNTDMSWEEIGNELGYTKQYVERVFRQSGFKKERSTAAVYDAIKKADRTVWGWQARIAEDSGLSRAWISDMYKRLIDAGEIKEK